jgi:hypothetical protein
MSSKHPITIDILPTELLAHVFSFFDGPAPSDTRLHDQPEIGMLKSPDEVSLKNISLVSKRWRAIALPMLFHHVVWALDRYLLLAEPADASDPVDMIPLLSFLRANDLGHHVQSFTILVKNRMLPAARRPSDGAAAGSFSEASARWPNPDAELSVGRSRFHSIANSAAAYNEDNDWVWNMLFGLMDPLRFTIIASPHMLASLLSCMLFVGDADSFSDRQLLHILSLSRESRSTRAEEPGPSESKSPSESSPPRHACSSKPKRKPSALFTIRPWTHLLLNEGSSIRVYKNYEFFLRRPPSILGALLGSEESPNDTPLIPPTITSLSYVAIFPLSSHFSMLVWHLPRLEHLFVQLVPRNDVLLDPVEMRNVHASDLWMERNSCYGLVMRKMLSSSIAVFGVDDDDEGFSVAFDGDPGAHGRPRLPPAYNWRFLRVFESGDAADKEAWEMAVEYLNMGRTRWRVEGDGTFVKGPVLSGEGNQAGVSDEGESEGFDVGGGDDDGDGDGDGNAIGTGTEILSVPPETFSPW